MIIHIAHTSCDLVIRASAYISHSLCVSIHAPLPLCVSIHAPLPPCVSIHAPLPPCLSIHAPLPTCVRVSIHAPLPPCVSIHAPLPPCVYSRRTAPVCTCRFLEDVLDATMSLLSIHHSTTVGAPAQMTPVHFLALVDVKANWFITWMVSLQPSDWWLPYTAFMRLLMLASQMCPHSSHS